MAAEKATIVFIQQTFTADASVPSWKPTFGGADNAKLNIFSA